MPAKFFKCPDGETIEIDQCLQPKGCRMRKPFKLPIGLSIDIQNRCGTLPYLRLVGYDREWRGVTPSAAGTGPRLLYLRATTDYTIDPNGRTFAAFGTSTHDKLAMHKYTYDVLSEEKLSDKKAHGIADVLEQDDDFHDYYILNDYKTYGSFKVAKLLGLVKTDIPLLDSDGNVILLKSGKNKGQPKTVSEIKFDPYQADLKDVGFQLNRYRIFFNQAGFKISHMRLQVIVRDGGTRVAKNRGLERNLYMIDVPMLSDSEVIKFYDELQAEVDGGFDTGYVRRCNDWEAWDGRRCKGSCEVAEACQQMDIEFNNRTS